MQPLAAAVEHDVTRLHISTVQHRPRFETRRKRYKGQAWRQLQVG